MKKVLQLFFVVTLTFLTIAAISQQQSFIIDNYTTEQGLSHNFSDCIIQDNEGFIWVGTHNGLNRFDGYKFKTFLNDTSDKESLVSVHIMSLLKDRNGSVWVGTVFGLDKFDKKREKFQHISDLSGCIQIKALQIKSLLEDFRGKIWVGTYGKGLYQINPATMKIEAAYHQSEKGLSSDFINALYEDDQRNIWIGTWGGGLNMLNPVTGKFSRFEKVSGNKNDENVTINTISAGKNGNLILGTWQNGVCIFDQKSQSIKPHKLIEHNSSLDNESVISFKQDKAGNYWFTTFNQGLFQYNPHSKTTFNFRTEAKEPFYIKSNMTWGILEDRYGVIWVSTYGAGILKLAFPKSSFKQITNKSSEHPTALINCLFEKRLPGIWIGTQSKGLFHFDTHKRIIEYFIDPKTGKNPIPNNSIKCITEDRRYNLWIGLDKGFCRYNRSTGKVDYYSPNTLAHDTSFSLKNIGVTTISCDSLDNIWIGTFDAGVYKLNPLTLACQFYRNIENDPESLSNNVIWSIACDANNNVWIGTRNMLNRYNPEKNNFVHYTPNPNKNNAISHHVISQVISDSKKRLWIATLGGGVNLFNPSKDDFSVLNTKTGLPDNTIYSIADDKNGNIWFSSSKGITRYNPETKELNNYNKTNGLTDFSFNLSSCLTTRSGMIFFGGNNGLTVFHPDSINEFSESPSVIFTAFKMFNKEINIGEKIGNRVILSNNINNTQELTLHYRDNNIAFEFAVLDFESPETNVYAYKLEGFDNDWILTDANRRFANYTNLSPGNYVFKVKATNHNGVWSKNIKSIKFIVEPPFYKTFWFIALITIALVSLVFFYINYRLNYYQKQGLALQKMVDKQTAEIKRKNEYLEFSNKELEKQKEEISKQHLAISQMNERIKEADNKKTRFFTNISHEIRTPLTLIIGPLESAIEKTSIDDPRYSQLLLAQKNANRLLKLINELLDFSKLDTESMLLNLQLVDIVKFTSDIFSLFSQASLDKKLEFSFETSQPCIIASIDISKVEIILFNLISNACKYTPEGGKIFFSIEAEDNAEFLKFIVKDTGIGIPEDRISKIFDRYYQIESENHKTQGTGIGLALTKELSELMNGSITVSSQPGIGSNFVLQIPYIRYQQKGKDIQESEINYSINNRLLNQYLSFDFSPNPTHNERPGTIHKLLIIDDNADLRFYIKSCFIGKYQVFEAENGIEGLEIAGNEFPNIIISDIMMPEMDGIELCKKLKSNLATSHIPVILLTARSGVNEQIEGLETGADDYIPKPFNKEILLLKVHNLINARENLRSLFSSKINFEPHEITVTSTDEKFISEALAIVENNIDNPSFGAAELVSALGMSRTLVHMKFKELTQTSTGEFIKTIRLKRACQLLKMNKLRVSEVGFKVGFSDPQYFTKTFKSQFGLTPTEYAEKDDI